MKYKLLIKKYKQSGDITWEYNALRNIKLKDGSISNFKIKNSSLNLNLESPVDIECQPSYDGTVNLILNDDINPPRIINTRWSRTENNSYKIINREQINQSNLYNEEHIDRETRLFRNVDGVTKIDLSSVSQYGKLKAGNYIIYMKYMDDDYNETDIVAQTGVISIFNGTPTNPKTVSGGLMDEETDKSIVLKLRDIDTSFTYYKLYVYRTTCDSNGVKLDYAYKIKNNYEINNSHDIIYINGYEEYQDISVEEINIQYNIVDSVKTHAQVQNMLFFGNVTKPEDRDSDLQDMSLYIIAKEINLNNSIGFLEPENYLRQKEDDPNQVEYYSPINIYYNLGYWPDEIYRFGIVYIYNDDHLSPVYNLRGCKFKRDENGGSSYNIDPLNNDYNDRSKNKIPYSDDWINGGSGNFENTKGVFKFSKSYDKLIKYEKDNDGNIKKKGIYPIGINFSFPEGYIEDLQKKKIKGFFFVRQPRIPTVLCQGYSVGIDRAGYFPMLKMGDKYIIETFKDEKNVLTTSAGHRQVYVEDVQSSGLLCVDAYLDKKLQGIFDTSEFKLEKIITPPRRNDDGSYPSSIKRDTRYRHYFVDTDKPPIFGSNERTTANLIYIDPEIPQKVYKDMGFSTKAGMSEDIRYCGFIEHEDPNDKDVKITRGIFTSYIGTTERLDDCGLYNIRLKSYDESFAAEYFEIRMNDNSPYFAVSERYCINPKKYQTDYKFVKEDDGTIKYAYSIDVFRGDCFTNTVTTRMHRNFVSSSVPINDTIINNNTWKNNFEGFRETVNWNKINKADIDAVPIGSWMTYKCLSNYNLSLRCIDPFHVEEQAIMGNPRSFYPLQDISVKSSNKINESNLMNSGYNSLLGIKRNFTFDVVPYDKDVFDTRIMFSNIQVDGVFKNSYKVFQGLSYEDIDRQYGSITKIIPWGVNLFCVFEHGLAIIPVNEKALLQTTEGSNIHMYGSGVLQKQVVLISDSVGSTWKDSIIKTPVAIYGVDSETHKIWRYSDNLKLEILSDFSMQRYLHDNIDLKELEKYVILGVRNIKTHYNAFKGDIMFTYYNNDKIWNICYNEKIGKWVTRYSWTPFMSENIDHSMLSFDLLRTRIFGLINTNLGRSKSNSGVNLIYYDDDKCIINNNSPKIFDIDIHPYSYYNLNKIVVNGYYWDENHDRVKSNILYNTDDCDYDLNKNIKYNGGVLDDIINENTIVIDDIISCNVFNINNIDNNVKSDDKLSNEKIMYNLYKKLSEDNKLKHPIYFNWDETDKKYLYYNIVIYYTPYSVSSLIHDNTSEEIFVLGDSVKTYTVGFIKDTKILDDEFKDPYNKALLSSLFVHGRSLNADEISYFDKNMNNQCLPTKWYDTQHPFEFEVVVNDPKGFHKIFDNLMIVSNNVEPESFEVEITGDVYEFNKKEMYDDPEKNVFVNIPIIPAANVKENKDKENIDYRLQKEVNTRIHWDPIENNYSLAIHQDSINIKDYGRRLGNIYYNEDKWYISLKPIYYKDITGSLKSTRIRDKYAKIRVKYSGEKLAIIVALQTMFTLSYV